MRTSCAVICTVVHAYGRPYNAIGFVSWNSTFHGAATQGNA